MKIYMVIVVCTALFVGCINYRPSDPYDRLYPKHPVWRLNYAEPNPDNIISYDCIYVAHNHDYYRIYRFWPSGQFMRHRQREFNIELGNSFQSCGIGYFRVVNGVVWLEYFGDADFGSYGLQKGYVDDNGDIKITHWGRRTRFPSFHLHRLNKPWLFRRTEAELKAIEPDW